MNGQLVRPNAHRNLSVAGRRVSPSLAQALRLVASAARVAGSARSVGRVIRNAKRPSASKKVNKKAPPGLVKIDGTTSGSSRVYAKKRKTTKKTKSLVSRVKALERNAPKKTVKRTYKQLPWKSASAINSKKLFTIDVVGHLRLEGALNAIDGVDYTAKNTSVLVRGMYSSMQLKNSRTANMNLAYCLIKCIDDTSVDPLDDIKAYLVDRGMTVVGTVTSDTAAGATNSFVPGFLDLDDAEIGHSPLMSGGGLTQHWKVIGGVKKSTIGPGDNLVITHKLGNRTYRPEVLDRNPNTYLKGDYRMLMWHMGDISHDNTNKNVVGYSASSIDAVQSIRFDIVVDNGLGLRITDVTNAITSTGFTDPVHIDNTASAVETAQE